MKTQREKFNIAVLHVLSFASFQLMQSAFALSAETEPWVTKGLKAPDYLFDTEETGIICFDLQMEYLAYVEDKNVIRLIRNMERVLHCKQSFENINGIDFSESITDDEIYNMALEVYVEDDDRLTSYEERVNENCDFHFCLYFNIWKCAEILLTQSIEISEQQEENFFSEMYDFVDGDKKSDNSNVQLLFDLMVDLEKY
ncbi:MAG: hypothetical protein WKF66_00015 [Pedobacter sp.]